MTSTALQDAAASGDANRVRSELAAGADVHTRGEYGDTALNIAAEHGHEAIVGMLLAAGADIENFGGADKTPIMNAAFAGHVPVVRLLIEKGARISDALLESVGTKVGIIEENAEAGMAREEAADAWRGFHDWLVSQRRKQDSQA